MSSLSTRLKIKMAVVAALTALIAGAMLTLIWTPLVFGFQPDADPEMPHGAKAVILYVCYVPLVAWGPLLAAVTVAYAAGAMVDR